MKHKRKNPTNGKRDREQRFSDHNDNMSPRENGHLVSYGHRYGRIAVAGLRGHARVDFSVHPEIPRTYGLPVSLELGFQRDDKGHLETITMNVRETIAVARTYANRGAAARLTDDA